MKFELNLSVAAKGGHNIILPPNGRLKLTPLSSSKQERVEIEVVGQRSASGDWPVLAKIIGAPAHNIFTAEYRMSIYGNR